MYNLLNYKYKKKILSNDLNINVSINHINDVGFIEF